MKRFSISNVMIAAVVIGVIMLIILPIPGGLLDVFIVINIAVSLIILLTTMYIDSALQFSVMPTLLLVTTVFRLALNINSTKLILGNNGDAGDVIKTFATFVIGDNIVVGVITFLIILAMQFVVITKGAERVAEVAARFTLDAMPGKQMAIDADLNSGLIDEHQAMERRSNVQREADFYGAMDGASKFVKGDAILGILITIINIVGGLVLGLLFSDTGMTTDQIIETYAMATVGDGLVSQIPSLLISTAMGIIVTRSASKDTLGIDLSTQLFNQPMVMIVAGISVLLLSFIPGMPKIPMFAMAALFITIGIISYRRPEEAPEPEVDEVADAADQKRKPESVTSLLGVDPIELEFGYGIIPLVDATQGGDLLDRVVMIRRQCALDLGIIVPVIRMRDNIQLSTSEYIIKIKGVEVARGEVMVDHFMALDAGGVTGAIPGIETIEPAFGLPALWITEQARERAELMGYTTIDPPSVIATHLTEIVKRYAHELLGRQQVQTLLNNLKQSQPALVDEVTPKLFSLGEIQKILGSLLRENVPIRDLATVLETLGDYAGMTRDADLLTEYVRQRLKRGITRRFVPDNHAHVITLSPELEQNIVQRIKQTEGGAYVAMEPEMLQHMFENLRTAIERVSNMGITPIVLTAAPIRRHFKKITEQLVPDLIVLSYNELEQNVEIFADGVVSA